MSCGRVRAAAVATALRYDTSIDDNREEVVRHVIGAEYDMCWKVGIPAMPADAWRDDANLRAHRDEYVAAIRQYHAEGKLGRKWPLHFLIRHTAFHTLDHTWEMEDRDLTPGRA